MYVWKKQLVRLARQYSLFLISHVKQKHSFDAQDVELEKKMARKQGSHKT
jgi:hypothetical protein